MCHMKHRNKGNGEIGKGMSRVEKLKFYDFNID